MRVIVELGAGNGTRPPAGAPVRVQVRDTTYADTVAPVVAETTALVEHEPGGRLGVVELELAPDAPAELTVWAHVDVDEDARVSRGDFVTTASYPVGASDAGTPLRVVVRQVS